MEFSPQIARTRSASGIYDSPMEGISINFSILLEYIVQNPSITILVTILGSSLNRIRQNGLTLQK